MEFVEIKHSEKARHLRMQAGADRIIKVVVPRGMPRWKVEGFIKQNQDWIDKHMARIKMQEVRHPKHRYEAGEVFYYLGEPYALSFPASRATHPLVKMQGQELQVLCGRSLGMGEIRSALESFFKKKAEGVIHDRLEHFNAFYGFPFARVTFRNQKSRWGSCSRRRNLNFNWRLVMAPIEVLDYVVVHELCHLKEMNHSSRFWALVAHQVEDSKAFRKWLHANKFMLDI
jgi:predicted metal-dependent hydrolase